MKDINITVKKQPNTTIFEQYPPALAIAQSGYQTNGNYSEESYTGGSLAAIEAKKEEIKDGLASNVQATFTITSEAGSIYTLNCRYEELTQSPYTPEAMQEKYGTAESPRTLSISISSGQQSCLNHPIFAGLDSAQLGALQAYQAGKSPTDVGINAQGLLAKLEDIISRSDPLAMIACQYPTYQVPLATITLGIWAEEQDTSSLNSFYIVPSVAGITAPAGLAILYCGTTNQQVENGWQIQKTYAIGDFSTAFYNTSSASLNE